MNPSTGRFVLALAFGTILGVCIGQFLPSMFSGDTDSPGGLAQGATNQSLAKESGAGNEALVRLEGASNTRTVAEASRTIEPARTLSKKEVDRLVRDVPAQKVERRDGTGVIRGHVFDTKGNPMTGVLVRARTSRAQMTSKTPSDLGLGEPKEKSLHETVQEAAERYQETKAYTFKAYTDALGAYQFDTLPNRVWRMSAFLKGYKVDPVGSAWGTEVGSEADFTASPLSDLPVEVIGVDGARVTEAILQVKPDTVRARATRYMWTPEEDYLRLTPGDYEVIALSTESPTAEGAEYASEKQTVHVTEGETQASLQLALRGRLSIAGTVKFADKDIVREAVYVKLLALSPGQAVDPELLGKSEIRERVLPGAPFAFPDLEPGAYALGVVVGWNAKALHHEVVEVTDGPVRCDLTVPEFDRSQVMIVSVTDGGDQALDGAKFILAIKSGQGRSTRPVQSMRDNIGRYLLLLSDEQNEQYFEVPGAGSAQDKSAYTLTVELEKFGTKKIKLKPGQTEIDVEFSTPGDLTVTVSGYQGSGHEGRLGVLAVNSGETETSLHRFGNNQPKFGPNGEVVLDNLTPGNYDVSLVLQPKDAAKAMYGAPVLETKTVIIRAGSNQVEFAMPALYDLRVHFAEHEEGTDVQLGPKSSGNPHMSSQRAKIDANGYALWSDLTAGEYTLRINSVYLAQMDISVPSGEVEYVPTKVNSLRVHISDEGGDLSKAGFQEGDLIIGEDGAEFEDAPRFTLLGKLMKSDSVRVNFLIMRGNTRMDLVVEGKAIDDWQSLGGNLIPYSN